MQNPVPLKTDMLEQVGKDSVYSIVRNRHLKKHTVTCEAAAKRLARAVRISVASNFLHACNVLPKAPHQHGHHTRGIKLACAVQTWAALSKLRLSHTWAPVCIRCAVQTCSRGRWQSRTTSLVVSTSLLPVLVDITYSQNVFMHF